MITCRDITELATDYAEGALEAPQRRSFEAHLAGCDGCRGYLGRLEVTVRAVQALPPSEPPASVPPALLAHFDRWQAARAATATALAPTTAAAPVPAEAVARPSLAPATRAPFGRAAWALPVALGLGAALLGLAHHPSTSPEDWGLALGLVAVAVALAAVVKRLTPAFALSAVSAALVAALVRGGEGDAHVVGGLECLLSETAIAAGTVAAGFALARGGASRVVRPALAALAVTGALVGDAALQIACSQRTSLPHLLLFHAGGVFIITVIAWWTGGSRMGLPAVARNEAS